MSTTILTPLQGFAVENIVGDAAPIMVIGHMDSTTAACPQCGRVSARVHSLYTRTLRALPWGSVPVILQVTARRWFCDDGACPKKIFCERIEDVAPIYARRTTPFTSRIAQLGWASGAETASRVACRMGVPVSAATVLRILRATPDPVHPPPTVIGIDDWALRKGMRYGTIVVDQERHEVVDVLPDREEETVAVWLSAHPEVTVVTRDRDGVYAKAVAKGAPQARQVADRWHLINNLAEVTRRIVARLHPHAVPAGEAAAAVADREPPVPSPDPLPGQRHRQARYEAVQALHHQGLSQREIASRLGLDRKTVRKYARADQCPAFATPPRRPRVLGPWEGLLSSLWDGGTHNTRRLWRILQKKGYRGGYSTIRAWATKHRGKSGSEPEPGGRRRSRSLRSRILAEAFNAPWARWPQSWTAPLSTLLDDPALASLWTLTHLFRVMVTHRQGHHLDAWLRAAEATELPELKRFARGIRRDFPAVYAALTEPWSQGVVEGFNNKLKFQKRLMFGRANFDLVRKRMLHSA